MLVVIHLMVLHSVGRSDIVGIRGSHREVPFAPSFVTKDIVNVTVVFITLLLTMALNLAFIDYNDFVLGNSQVSPEFIPPPLYFSGFYAILLRCPGKLSGVVLILARLGAYLVLGWVSKIKVGLPLTATRVFLGSVVLSFIILTFLGVEHFSSPNLRVGMLVVFFYFFIILVYILLLLFWNFGWEFIFDLKLLAQSVLIAYFVRYYTFSSSPIIKAIVWIYVPAVIRFRIIVDNHGNVALIP